MFSSLRKWLPGNKQKPDGGKVLPEVPDKPPNALYLLYLLWRQKIDKTKWYSLLVTVPMLVFLAISGLLAWIAVFGGFIVRIVKMITT